MSDGARRKAAVSDWAKLKVTDLKAELRRRGLGQAGLKAELIARLEADDSSKADSDDAAAKETTPEPNASGEEYDVARVASRKPSSQLEVQLKSMRHGNRGSETAPDTSSPTAQSDMSDGSDDAPVEAKPSNEQEPATMRAAAGSKSPPGESGQTGTETEGNDVQAEATSDQGQEQGYNQEDDQENDQANDQANDQVGGHTQVNDHQVIDHDQVDDHHQVIDHDQAHDHPDPLSNRTAQDSPAQSQAVAESASSDPNKSMETTQALQSELPDDMQVEPPSEALKRKRRSASHDPNDESVKRRRAHQIADDAPQPSEQAASDVSHQQSFPFDDEPDGYVEPALHECTSALYINNLMRPMKEADLKAHLIELASRRGQGYTQDDIVDFYVDSIRTHAFVVLNSVSAATRIRHGLHDRIWPQESTRKPLFVDFVPADKVADWIDMEESQARDKKPGMRWQVVYQSGHAMFQLISIAAANSAPPSGRAVMPQSGIEGAPTGPRGYLGSAGRNAPPRQVPAIPTGPRADRFSPPPPAASTIDIDFQPVAAELAHQRLLEMRSYFTGDRSRHHGRDINRYSFQDGDKFVDRGREVFEGIRPPRRQQAVDRERQAHTRGFTRRRMPAPRPPRHDTLRGDRYVPADVPLETAPDRSPIWRRDGDARQYY